MTQIKRVFTSMKQSSAKRVFIIHGWGGRPENDWLSWLKIQLEEKGYSVNVPDMPDHDYPKINAWVSKLAEVVGTPESTDIFVGHSIGCQTIIRYLENTPEDTKIDKVIFVAGWHTLSSECISEDEDKEIAQPWVESPINFEKVKDKANSFIALFSEDDPDVPFEENKNWIEMNLNPEIHVYKNKGHFTTADGVVEIPEVLEFF